METYKEKADQLFDRVGPLKLTDEEVMRLADVTEDEVGLVRHYMHNHSVNIYMETQP